MEKRDVMRLVFEGKRPPYVPWSCGFTKEAHEKLVKHFGTQDLEEVLQNHLLPLGNQIGFFEDIGNDCVRDAFGVVWDRGVDKDIGQIKGLVLPEPAMAGYQFPDPCDQRFFSDIPGRLTQYRGKLVFHGGLSTQRTLPYGTVEDVRRETRHLLELGREGGYIFSPAHAVEGDVPLENMLAFIEEMQRDAWPCAKSSTSIL